MKPSHLPNRLLAILFAAFVAMAGSAHAQLEYFEKTSDLASISDEDLEDIFDQVQAGKIFQIKITGSIIPTFDTTGSPFGIDGMSSTPVPVIAYVIVDTNRSGPTVTQGGSTGYQGNQILAVYIHVGPENSPLKEIGFINFTPLSSKFTPSALDITTFNGSGESAQLWVNQDLDTGTPTIASIRLDNGMDNFRFGPVHSINGGILGGVYVEELPDNSTGDVTSVQVRNLTQEFGAFLGNEQLREIALTIAKSKLNKAKKKAKKAKLKADAKARKKAKKALKKAKKKAKKAQTELNAVGDPF